MIQKHDRLLVIFLGIIIISIAILFIIYFYHTSYESKEESDFINNSINIVIVNSSVDKNLKYFNESENRQFEKTEIKNKVIYFYQNKIDEAIVEKNQVVYIFDKDTNNLVSKTENLRKDLPEHLPLNLISKEKAEQIAGGVVQFSNLYYLSPDSDVFPFNYTKTPCWIVQTIKDGSSILLVIDATNGTVIGNGISPPYSAFSLSGPTSATSGSQSCSGSWNSWYKNAEYWFNYMGYSTESVLWPTEVKIREHIQSNTTALFYELAHGDAYGFAGGCGSSGYISALDIFSWIESYEKMPFSFVGSCGGMCDAEGVTFSWAFRKGSNKNTTTVGYCGMGTSQCSNCWTQSVAWQNTLFDYMSKGYTVKLSFDMANENYPACSNYDCMRFTGDENFRVYPLVLRGTRRCSYSWEATVCGDGSCSSSERLYKKVSYDCPDDPLIMKCVSEVSCGEVKISNCTQLQNINYSGSYILTNDIDCSDTKNWNNGKGFVPVGNSTTEFTGNFNGNGFNISNLFINRPTESRVGLFGHAAGNISNIGLVNINVTGYFNVGGLVGYQNSGTIINSYSTGNITSSSHSVGGLVGYQNSGTIINSYSTGRVTGHPYTGGLVGYQKSGTIINSYSTGRVNGGSSYAGGLVGKPSGTVVNSYWDINTSGKKVMCGGSGSGCTNANGKTTAEMKQQSTFVGWDFNNIWNINLNVNNGYPFFLYPKHFFKEIRTCEELQEMSNNLSGNYQLMNDINCSETRNWNDGTGFLPVGVSSPPVKNFNGSLNGNNYTIYNLYINDSGKDYVGLFGAVNYGFIQDIYLENVSVFGKYNYVAGLVGLNIHGNILNCHSVGQVFGSGWYTGGLVGFNGENGVVSNSYSNAIVFGGSWYTGGLVGSNAGYIFDSYSLGNVTGIENVGGLVGHSSGTISNSYSTGNVFGNRVIGGFVGALDGNISNSYSIGNVSGPIGGFNMGGFVGGMVGSPTVKIINNSYWDINKSGKITSAGGVGKTTAQMKQQSTFIGWDFNNIWNINLNVNKGYPILKVFNYTESDLPAEPSSPAKL